MRRTLLAALGAAILVVGGSVRGDAHEPITSPYTFTEDVLPIVQARCAACHAPGGIAPMSLLTHADAVPWGESMKAELLGGHMPPFRVDGSPGRFRNADTLTARELNVLLTWVSGGTPPGAATGEAAPAVAARPAASWPLGTPDLVLRLPADVTLPAGTLERVESFTVQTGLTEPRWIRAADILPGTPAMVRSAIVTIAGEYAAANDAAPVLALWQAGDHPVPFDDGAGIRVAPGAELRVTVRYRKTWEYEQQALTDRSAVGLYFAPAAAADVRTLQLAAGAAHVVGAITQVLAIAPHPQLAHTGIRVTATRPDGRREDLIAFHPQAGWARRYWFRTPITLPRGTRLEMIPTPADARLEPPGAPPRPAPDPGTLRVTLDVLEPSS